MNALRVTFAKLLVGLVLSCSFALPALARDKTKKMKKWDGTLAWKESTGPFVGGEDIAYVVVVVAHKDARADLLRKMSKTPRPSGGKRIKGSL